MLKQQVKDRFARRAPDGLWTVRRGLAGTSRRTAVDNRRRGMTLIELLVVATILIVLMGVALPLMRPALEESRIREASRQLNAFVQTAKLRSAEHERDFGLWIERSTVESNAAFEVYLAERPRPYAGDLMNAKALLFDTLYVAPNGTTSPGQDGIADRAVFSLSETASMLQLVQADDLIQFDYKGPQYRITTDPAALAPASSGAIFVDFALTDVADPGPQPLSVPNGVQFGVPFQISRSPVKVSTRPLQFSGGVIIDLQHSGMGLGIDDQFAAGNASPVIIMFRPSGAISQVIIQGGSQPPSATVHLLLGRFDGREAFEATAGVPNPIAWSNADATSITYSKNVVNQKSIWVAIGNRNGTVTTSPNGWALSPGGAGPYYMLNSLAFAREFAQTGQTDGGG